MITVHNPVIGSKQKPNNIIISGPAMARLHNMKGTAESKQINIVTPNKKTGPTTDRLHNMKGTTNHNKQ